MPDHPLDAGTARDDGEAQDGAAGSSDWLGRDMPCRHRSESLLVLEMPPSRESQADAL
jgi:hypothetical protein